MSQRKAMMLDPATNREIRAALSEISSAPTTSRRPATMRLSREDVESMTLELGDSLRARRDASLIWMLWEGRLNRSEIVDLRWRHVSFDSEGATAVVRINGRCTRDVRLVTLYEEEEPVVALMAWRALRRRRDDEPVFVSIPWNNGRISSVALSPNDVSRIVRRRALEAGLGPVTARSLMRP